MLWSWMTSKLFKAYFYTCKTCLYKKKCCKRKFLLVKKYFDQISKTIIILCYRYIVNINYAYVIFVGISINSILHKYLFKHFLNIYSNWLGISNPKFQPSNPNGSRDMTILNLDFSSYKFIIIKQIAFF